MKYLYARGMNNSDNESNQALHVNNCGYYKALEQPICIARPTGRRDYHLLLCVRGEISVGEERLQNGDAYLFEAHREQRYTYLPAQDSFYFWVHFTGTELPTLLQSVKLTQGKYTCTAHLSELESLLRMMISKLNSPLPAIDTFCAGLLCSVLTLLPHSQIPHTPFANAVKMLEDLSSDVSISALADMYKMSTGHFIRAFRSYFGISPYQHRRKKQIDLAKILLAESDLSVAEISARVGLSDPLYFSRIFKKQVGASPSAYRHSH